MRLQQALLSPILGCMHGLIELVKAVDGEKQAVDSIHSHGSLEDLFQIEISDFAAALDYIGTFTVRADHSAAVDLDGPILANQAESDAQLWRPV